MNVPDENPSGLGAFEFDLRFPGQVWTKETQTSYNYLRDCYDPATGRYCQPDPIGTVLFRDRAFRNLGGVGLLERGLGDFLYSERAKYNHLYAYVGGNPISKTDPTGLIVVCNDLDPGQCIDTNEKEDPNNQQNAMCKLRCKIDYQWVCLGAGLTGSSRGGIIGGAATGGSCFLIKNSICNSYCDNIFPPCKDDR